MISIIISKYHPTQIEGLKSNIENTIGVPFELVIIENGRGEMGLCEVYNTGAQKARYELLCYTHEDVAFETMNWGTKVIEIFNQNVKLGLLGVAGSGFKSLSPSGWWYPDANPQTVSKYYIQSNRTKDKAELQYSNPGQGKLSPVVCVDGFWFCTLKKIVLELKFDDSTFKGFHCYDIDFSLTVLSRQYEAVVSFEILIKHFSEGCLNGETDWINETLKLFKKWKNFLPMHAVNLSKQILVREEIKALDYFLKVMLQNNFPLRQVLLLLQSINYKSLIGVKAFTKTYLKLVKEAVSSYNLRKKPVIVR